MLVCLGEERDAKTALEFLEVLQESHHQNELGLVKNDPAKLSACVFLFYQRLWWSRIWTLQEVLRRNSILVYIGALVIQLDDLCSKFRPFDLQDQSSDGWGAREWWQPLRQYFAQIIKGIRRLLFSDLEV